MTIIATLQDSIHRQQMIRESFFISQRFLRTITSEKNIATMLAVCFTSIAIGTFALALVAAIMSGFEKTTHTKLQGIHTDITIQSFTKAPLAYKKIKQVIKTEFSHLIAHTTPYSTKHAIIQADASNDISNIVVLQGINPNSDAKTRALANAIQSPLPLIKTVTANKLLIGSSLAHSLQVETGDPVTLLYPEETSSRSKKIAFDHTDLTIGGIFKTGIDDFDSSFIFCSHQTLQNLFPDTAIDEIGIKLQPQTSSSKVIQKLKDRFNLDVFSWQDLYPALISALILEKYAMIMILTLVALVASMNIISLLFMYITQKRGTIALLKAMGMQNKYVRRIFTIVGMSISMSAGALGLIAACGASWALDTYQLIKLPDVYYSSYLPSDMNWHIIALVIFIVFFVSLGATWFATRRIKYMSIAKTLKFEG